MIIILSILSLVLLLSFIIVQAIIPEGLCPNNCQCYDADNCQKLNESGEGECLEERGEECSTGLRCLDSTGDIGGPAPPGECTVYDMEDFLSSTFVETGLIYLFDPEGNIVNQIDQDWVGGEDEDEAEETLSLDPVNSDSYCAIEGQYYFKFQNDCVQQGVTEQCTEGYGWFSTDEGLADRIDAHKVNWDTNESSCTCLDSEPDMTTDWNLVETPHAITDTGQIGGPCCGDDKIEDSGFLADEDRDICINNASDEDGEPSGNWEWLSADEGFVVGDVYRVQKGRFDVVSDGTKWIACNANNDGTENFGGTTKSQVEVVSATQNQETYEYICFLNNSIELFGECIIEGKDTHNAGTSGASFTIGESLQGPTEIHFCADNGRWYDDLDLKNGNTCEKAKDLERNLYGLSWTGSLCCGDPDDPLDTYNDVAWIDNPLAEEYPGPIGGCFRKTKVDTDTRVSDMNLIVDGTFDNDLTYWTSYGTAEIIGAQLQLTSGDSYAYQDISNKLYPNKLYNLSASLHRGTLTNGHPYVALYSNNIQVSGSDIHVESGSGSITKSIIFTAPSDTSNLQVRAYIPSGASGYVYFDNIKLSFADNSIMNYNGSFYGCSMSDAATYQDNYHNTPLIPPDKNLVQCNVLGNYFCSYHDGWSNELEGAEAANQRNTTSPIPTGLTLPGIPVSCCPQSYCWNGTSCVQSTDPNTDPETNPSIIKEDDDNRWVCMGGNWEHLTAKPTWDSRYDGYCISDSQCLMYPLGNLTNNNGPGNYSGEGDFYDEGEIEETPQCINNTQYAGDHYCDNGEWTSRTKYIALQLLDLVDNNDNYSLFCDFYDNALNDYSYSTVLSTLQGPDPPTGAPYLYYERRDLTRTCSSENSFPCTNNFCILEFENSTGGRTVALGTSLNHPVNSDFLGILDFTDPAYCDGIIGTEFVACMGDNTIWYNSKYNAVIFSKQGISLENPDWLSDSLRTSYLNILTTLSGTINSDWSTKANDYKKLYIAKLGGKTIKGFVETMNIGGTRRTLMVLDYSGFTADICKSIQVFNQNNLPTHQDILYHPVGDNCIMQKTYTSQNWYSKVNPIWINLTVPIRLRNS